ncbi:isoprenylcysteine alpha-carbonyl methylesterase ICMEL1 [Spatholobus suberectus]|nr:isoprenylcysteine alpha-carbonyl methylesterase ICMEL1 [Spatholobus suberectus]
MPSQILPMPNRPSDSAVSTPPILLRAKEDDNDPSASLLHSPPSFQDMSRKPPLPRASSFTATTRSNKASLSGPRFYQKRRRRAASQDSLPSVSNDTAATTRSSFGRDVASETFLLTRLGFKMLGYLGVGYKWITRFLALGCYAVLLLPGFIQVGYYYFFSNQIRRSIVYGDKPRNRLDLYLPKNSNGPKPVVAFVTGGAWIIGYKAWGSLLGQQLSERDIIVACIDYRNFPQGTISDMIADASQGISFVCNNIAEYGGDPNRIYLMGQSAGAHIAACAIVEQAIKEAGEGESTSWSLSQIKAYFGLSGGYNLFNLIDHFHARGLYRSIFLSIMEGEESLQRFSPEVMIQDPKIGNAISLLPPIVLFHGTEDYSIPSDASKTFAETLKRFGVTAESIMYEGKTHTDVFLQDPMRGGKDDMFEDLVAYIHSGDADSRARDAMAPPRRRLVPECMLKLAHSVSPF